jgi:hypothetical protein
MSYTWMHGCYVVFHRARYGIKCALRRLIELIAVPNALAQAYLKKFSKTVCYRDLAAVSFRRLVRSVIVDRMSEN